MSDPSQQCQSVWQKITITPHRVCGRISSGTCEGLTYSTGSEQYDQVCGRIISYIPVRHPRCTIDSTYLDGVSTGYIWSFTSGVDEENSISFRSSDRYPYIDEAFGIV